MARNGFPDDPSNYSDGDPTQYADFGGAGGEAYSEYTGPAYDQPPTGYPPQTGYGQYPVAEPPLPAWHHRPAVLIGLGVLTAGLLALLIYAIVSFTNAGSSTTPAVTSSATTATTAATSAPPATSGAPAPPGPTAQTAAPAPSGSQAPEPTTVTTTVTPTTTAAPTAPTTTESPTPSTVTSVTTSVTTVTETTTKPRWPTIPWPTPRQNPAPAGG